MHGGICDVVVVLEQAVNRVSPDLSDLHTDIVVARIAAVLDEVGHRSGQLAFVVAGVLGDEGAVVPEQALDAVGEGLAAEVELIPPLEGKLPAAGQHLCVVALGRGCAVHGGHRGAERVHIRGVAVVVVAAEREPAAQQVEVKAEVVGGGTLPGQGYGHHAGHGCVGRQVAAKHDVGGLADGHLGSIEVGAHVAVAHSTGGDAQLEVVHPAAAPLHPGLVRNPPGCRGGREESPLAVGRELGGTVIASADFQQILASVGVVQTGEGAHIRPAVAAGADIGFAVHKGEGGLAGSEACAGGGQGLVGLPLGVPSGQGGEGVVLAEVRAPG